MKDNREKWFSGIMVILPMVLWSFFVAIPSETLAQKPEYVSLGLIADLTGPYAPVVGPLAPGAEDGAKYVNEELGGIDGVKIKVETRDNQNKVALGFQQYAELIGLKPKPLFIGTTQSSISEPLLAKLAPDGVIGLSVSGSVPSVYPRGNQYALGLGFPDACAQAVKYVKDNWKENRALRLGIITWDSSYGRAILTDEFLDYCKKIGVEIVGTEFFKVGEIDLTTQMIRLRAKNPDWLATSSLGGGPLSILKVAKELGWNIRLLSGQAIDPGTIRLDPELLEGCVCAHAWMSFDETDHPGIKTLLKYMKTYKRTVNEQTGLYIHGWEMALIMHKVTKDAVAKVGWGKLNVDAIKYQMDHLDFEVLNGITRVTYTPETATTPWTIVYKIQKGKMINTNPGGGYVKAPDLRPAKFR